MNKPTYQLLESSDGYWYEFYSVTDNRVIHKAIGFYESVSDKDAVELVFGDLVDNKLDVAVVSDNKDFHKIINTVIISVYRFLNYTLKKMFLLWAVLLHGVEFIELSLPSYMMKMIANLKFMD